MPIIEIVPKSDFYDFESKYAVGGSQHICPARIPDDVTKVMQREAENAHKALSCSEPLALTSSWKTTVIVGRWRRTTIPGMTATSLLPMPLVLQA